MNDTERDLILYRISEVSRAVQILHETMSRRVYIDDVVDSYIVDVKSEIGLLRMTVTQAKSKEK